jgi:DNA adenine methylase
MAIKLLNKEFKESEVKPFLKWAGGKKQLWKEIVRHFPQKTNKYIEPFLGGGAIFFSYLPENAILSDSNPELINLYIVIRDKLEELFNELNIYKNEKEFFLKIRSMDTSKLTDIERAARMLYLNKTCFNGLYRVNKQGGFNTPFANYKNPIICDKERLKKASKALKGKILVCEDYITTLRKYAEEGDLIFLDPPYLPISENSDFKRYTSNVFEEKDHRELAKEFKRLADLGCTVILTNSNHPLVYELFKDFKIELHETRRNINSKGTKRKGADVIVVAEPKRQSLKFSSIKKTEEKLSKFPSTRYMGSKANLLNELKSISSEYEFETVLDAFSGTSSVSYMFKVLGKKVFSNDFMNFNYEISKALIENNKVKLKNEDLKRLLEFETNDKFIQTTFKNLYFEDEENRFIENLRAGIDVLDNPYKKALASAALSRACLKRRPRGIFTYTGFRYDDGRKDLKITLKDHFLEAVNLLNEAVYDNGKNNEAFCEDAMLLNIKADLVYIDPPYYSPLGDNDYTRRYHFVEGLSKKWEGLEIQEKTKTKKFKNYETPFKNKNNAYKAFDELFDKHKESILMVSYSSNSLPTMEEMMELLFKYKKKVEAYQISHQYSAGNQSHSNSNNNINEYVFVAY